LLLADFSHAAAAELGWEKWRPCFYPAGRDSGPFWPGVVQVRIFDTTAPSLTFSKLRI
jgi:hypothetical protein